MVSLASMIESNTDLVAATLLAIFAGLLIWRTLQVRAGRRYTLRPLRAYTQIQQVVSQATESGRPLHIGLGLGLLGGEATPESAMAQVVLDYAARHAAAANQPIVATTGNAGLLLSAQGTLQGAREAAGFAERYDPQEVRFDGPEGLTYAAGAASDARRVSPLASILLGRFGSEALWISERLSPLGLTQLGGSASPATAALLRLSLDATLVGEEVFAAGAYLHRPEHQGSLAAQDALRVILIVALLVGVVLTSLGIWR